MMLVGAKILGWPLIVHCLSSQLKASNNVSPLKLFPLPSLGKVYYTSLLIYTRWSKAPTCRDATPREARPDHQAHQHQHGSSNSNNNNNNVTPPVTIDARATFSQEHPHPLARRYSTPLYSRDTLDITPLQPRPPRPTPTPTPTLAAAAAAAAARTEDQVSASATTPLSHRDKCLPLVASLLRPTPLLLPHLPVQQQTTTTAATTTTP